MPRKKPAPAALPEGFIAAPDPIADQSYEDALEFLESFGGSASYCRIERFLRNGEKENCATVPYDAVRDDVAEYIREGWGGGRYHVSLLNEMKRWVAKRTVTIAVRVNAAQPALGAAPAAAAAAGGFDQFAMMREQMQADRQLLLTLLTRQNNGPDIGSILQGVAALTKQGDPAAMFAAMMTAFQTVRAASPDIDPMAQARNLIGLAKELAPGGGGGGDESEPTWLGVVKEVGGKFLDTIKPAVSAAAIAPGRPGAAAPAALAAAPPAAVEAEGEQTMASFLANVREGIFFLRAKALAGRPVDFWVDYLFEESTDLRFNAMIHAVQSGAAVEQLFAAVPEIAADPVEAEWFRQLHVGIKRALELPGGAGAGNGADLDSARPGGDSADARDNGVGGPP